MLYSTYFHNSSLKMSAHLARLPASAHPVCSVSNCGRYAGQLPSMRRVSSSCSLSSPELSGDYLPTASVLSEMPRSDDFSSNSSSMIFASSNCFRSFTICRLGYVCCKCCGGYGDHWSPEQCKLNLLSVYHSLFTSNVYFQ